MQAVTRPLLALAATFISAVAVSAQAWRTEAVPEAGIEFDAPSRLERLPMQLGDGALYHRARLRPKDTADFVRAQYPWNCDVYVFAKKESKDPEAELPADMPQEMKDAIKRLMAQAGSSRHRSFQAWLDAQKKGKSELKVVTAGKKMRGKSGKLDYAHWVWTVPEQEYYSPACLNYCEAAVFDFEDRQVAVVIEMPLESKNQKSPKSKWSNLIDRIVASGREIDPDSAAADSDAKRDKFADTPAKKEALAAAKANIQGLSGWDYFTQPNYIVIYSWDFEKPDERSKAKRDAIYYSERLEKMRELYKGNYPLDPTGTKAILPDPKSIPSLDGPTTGVPTTPPPKPAEASAEGAEEPAPPKEKLGTERYSVFRLCATYDQFMKYGQSPPGVVGWFSPASKELVVFLGGDKMMGSGATETVTYHEGWHQYADFYFDHPDRRKHDSLHRWFDEGHGDYFGSFRTGDPPRGIAIAPDGSRIYVSTSRNRIEVYNSSGTLLSRFGYGPGKKLNQFNAPGQMTVDAAGNLWIVDRGNNRIVLADRDGKRLAAFGERGSDFPEQFVHPTGVDVSCSGQLTVTDDGNNIVHEFGLAAPPTTACGSLPAPAPPPALQYPTLPDPEGPLITTRVLRRTGMLTRGVPIRVGCDATCRLTPVATLTQRGLPPKTKATRGRKASRRAPVGIALRGKPVTIKAGSSTIVRMQPRSTADVRRLRKALAGKRGVVLSATFTAAGDVGEPTSASVSANGTT